ncbi:MAG: formimidoylglutamase [Bacteroidia bacterium]
MNDLSEYFEPIDLSKLDAAKTYQPLALGNVMDIYFLEKKFPELKNVHIAIVGVEEDRAAVNNEGCGFAADYVRQYLYKLYQGNYAVKIADLGNIKKGFSVQDSYFAVTAVATELIKHNIIPLIIGGGQDITFANYLAYESLEQTINMVAIDPAFDLGDVDQPLDSRSYLSKIILHQPNFLFNFSNIGYQTYFTDTNALQLISKLYFDAYRIGQVRTSMEEAEPVIRNADLVTFDISAIRHSDAPGNGNASPNGFYGEEACQLVRYAGMSDKLSSIGFYEINPVFDKSGQTTHLVAQMIWYFIEGFYNRKKDYPINDKTEYLKYRVSIKNNKHEIIFYKSNKSSRWWMEVPYPPNKKIKYERHCLVPCSYSDYETACKEEVPDRWWQTFQKLS